ncbi:hypothetical protein AB0I77_06900 [Streptomyces sp. NPDC050619]|uniref:hypothetical protein n=1 Tax=Streptomyces sp. NPDC050619 TaxID=3157214 RepID=UPI003415868C
MTEGDAGATAPYTEATRARVVMAYEACELADLARAAVPIGEHELCSDGTVRSPGAVLADAVQVLRAAHRFLEAAAVSERLGGAGWARVGEVLGVPPQTARACFAAAEARFREELRSPEGAAARCWRACMAGHPLEAARDLDDWVLRHADGDRDLGPAPVSGGLVRRDQAAVRR